MPEYMTNVSFCFLGGNMSRRKTQQSQHCPAHSRKLLDILRPEGSYSTLTILWVCTDILSKRDLPRQPQREVPSEHLENKSEPTQQNHWLYYELSPNDGAPNITMSVCHVFKISIVNVTRPWMINIVSDTMFEIVALRLPKSEVNTFIVAGCWNLCSLPLSQNQLFEVESDVGLAV